MPFDSDLQEAVLKHSDIVEVIKSFVPVTKKGKNYFAVCPFHDDTNPSLSISPEKQIFRCFVCGASGNAVSFVMKYKGLPYFEALKTVAEISGFDDPRLHNTTVKVVKKDETAEPMLRCLKDLTLFYQYALTTGEGKEGLDYFISRNLDDSLREKFLLGYAYKDGKATCEYLQKKGHSIKTIEDIGVGKMTNGGITDKNAGRAIFPICNMNGEVVGYSARRIGNGNEAKYVNSPETYLFHKSKILYNYHNAKDKARNKKHIYVLEGFMDVFALAKVGIDNAVALMGTALTADHIQMLRNLNCEIRMCLDGDHAGQHAMMEACKLFAKAGMTCRIVYNNNSSKDPDEILNTEGKDALISYLNNLQNYPEFALNYYQNSNPLTTTEQKRALISEFVPILIGMNSQLEVDTYLRKLAAITSYDVESIRAVVNNVKNKKTDIVKAIASFHPERKVLRKLALAEREMLFQMLNHKKAVDFYEDKLGGFYDEVYRRVATYIVEYTKTHDDIDASQIISEIESSDLDNKEELIKELTALIYEKKSHPKCDDSLLTDLYDSISKEKNRIFEKDTLEQSLKGKSDIEKARIIKEFNERKFKA
ncbi:MAG: DNA primase [Bacilli bacterium]|nr:DNA primase [Bacilli bacterium]